MKITLLQVASPDDEPPAERRARVHDRVVSEAADSDLIVLPELWAVGFCHFDDYATFSEPLLGPTFEVCARIAARTGAWVHGGSIVEQSDDGRLRNTAITVRPDGTLAHRYSKVHV